MVGSHAKELEVTRRIRLRHSLGLLLSHKPISLKCVFKMKKNGEWNVFKHKAILVVKGYL